MKKRLKTVRIGGSFRNEIAYADRVDGERGPDGAPLPTASVHVTAYFVIPKVAHALAYTVSADGFNDPAYYGSSFGRSFSVATAGVEDRGDAWWLGLSAYSGPAASADNAIGYMNARFAGARVKAVVTLKR